MEKILDGELKFIPRVFVMRGRADWNSNIKTLSEPVLADYEEWNKEMKNGISHNKSRNVVMLECNKCHKLDPEYVLKVSILDVDEGIKCRHCNIISASKYWNCPCGIKWFLCDSHKWCIKYTIRAATDSPVEERSNKVAKKQSTGTKPCIPCVMVSHVELLKEDLIAEEYKSRQAQDPKSQKEIVLDDKASRVKRPRLLGPILAARFGVPSTHLGTSDESIKP